MDLLQSILSSTFSSCSSTGAISLVLASIVITCALLIHAIDGTDVVGRVLVRQRRRRCHDDANDDGTGAAFLLLVLSASRRIAWKRVVVAAAAADECGYAYGYGEE